MNRKPFKLLKEAAHEVAETLGVSLDETFMVSGLRYEFEKFVFVISQISVPEGNQAMTFKLEISGDDLDLHFRDLP